MRAAVTYWNCVCTRKTSPATGSVGFVACFFFCYIESYQFVEYLVILLFPWLPLTKLPDSPLPRLRRPLSVRSKQWIESLVRRRSLWACMITGYLLSLYVSVSVSMCAMLRESLETCLTHFGMLILFCQVYLCISILLGDFDTCWFI